MKVEINNLNKSFQGKEILNIKHLEFNAYKTHCIRGRNGTGKTTLLQIIAQLLDEDEGQILYDQCMINDKIIKNITYVSQNPYIFNASVLENIYYPLKIRQKQLREVEDQIKDYLQYFELDHVKHQNAKKCSSGEKMKTALIRSLIFQPKLLLLDEPTTNLDVESIEKLKYKLIEIKQETTIIFISHDLDFINAISDEQYLLKNTIIESGETSV